MNVMLNKHHVKFYVLTLSALRRQSLLCVCVCVYKLKLEKGSCMDLSFHEKFE